MVFGRSLKFVFIRLYKYHYSPDLLSLKNGKKTKIWPGVFYHIFNPLTNPCHPLDNFFKCWQFFGGKFRFSVLKKTSKVKTTRRRISDIFVLTTKGKSSCFITYNRGRFCYQYSLDFLETRSSYNFEFSEWYWYAVVQLTTVKLWSQKI